jgi:ABC-type nitrate/sulfonate/bicarbonate transport system permease component
MAVVTAELIAAHSGLGYMIQANRLMLETGLVLVGMCTIGILGAAMSFGLMMLETRVLTPWKVR